MAQPFIPQAMTVYVENGAHLVITPKGENIPLILKTTVTDPFDHFSNICIEAHCNIVGSKEEALRLYKEAAEKEK